MDLSGGSPFGEDSLEVSTPNQFMNQRTRAFALQLLAAVVLDPSAESDARSVFGNWIEHLEDQVGDSWSEEDN